jgi:Ca-activated chloride channel family protein
LRYKLPGEAASRLIEQSVRAADALAKIDSAPAEQRFAVAVAAFGQRLRGESALDGYAYARIAELANASRGADPEGYRAELVRLIRMAETLGAVAQRSGASMGTLNNDGPKRLDRLERPKRLELFLGYLG